MNFVVNSVNFREMIDFQKWANEIGATTHFSEYRKWGARIDNRYDEFAVFEKKHPLYKEYCKIVCDKIFVSDKCEINQILLPIK